MTEKDVMDNQKTSNVMENESKTVTETEKPSFPNLMVQNEYQAIKMNRKAKYSQLEDNLGVSDGGSGDRSLIRFCLGTAAGLRPAVTNVSSWECLQKSGTMDRYIGSLFCVFRSIPVHQFR